MPLLGHENVRHATLLFCAESVNVRTTGVEEKDKKMNTDAFKVLNAYVTDSAILLGTTSWQGVYRFETIVFNRVGTVEKTGGQISSGDKLLLDESAELPMVKGRIMELLNQYIPDNSVQRTLLFMLGEPLDKQLSTGC